MKNFKTKLFGVSIFVLVLAASCNHGFDKVIPGSPIDTANVSYRAPKVLYIIADGARGTSVRDANIPTLKSLIPNAIYTWNSLSDNTSNTDATNWASMITGVQKEKSNVLTEDFAGNNLAKYPPIFKRIKSLQPHLRIASFAASTAFKTFLTDGTDLSESFTSDAALTTRMSSFLKKDTASLIVGEFAGIEAAGNTMANGYDNSNPAYKAAISTFDTQVGTLLDSIKARPTFAKENWMIIITSNKGGAATIAPADDDKTVFSNPLTNTFTIIYNADSNPTFIGKPFVGNSYKGNSIRFIGDPQQGVARVSKANSVFFNFGSDSGFTISVKIKKHKNPLNTSRGDYYYQWPGFLGKRGNDANNTPTSGWGDVANAGQGWDFTLFQNRWRFLVSGVPSSGFKRGAEIAGMEFTGDNWHDLTAVLERKNDGNAYVSMYTDGVMGITNQGPGTVAAPLTTPYNLNNSGAASGKDVNFDSNSVLRLGYTNGEMDGGTALNSFGKIDVELKELKIFKTAIRASDVKLYACDQTIDPSNPYYSYLVGYWHMDEGSGTTIADQGPLAADFTLSENQDTGYTWQPFQDLICSPALGDLALQVPGNVDIPAQILSWFVIARNTDWGLDGKVWIAN